MITWRHFGKPEIVAVINNPILRASLQIWQLLTGRTAQGYQRTRRSIALCHVTRHARAPCDPRSRLSRIGERLEGRRRETVTWYQPPRDTKTVGAVLGVGHQRQMTPHPPPPARSDNKSTVNHSNVPANQSVFKTDW